MCAGTAGVRIRFAACSHDPSENESTVFHGSFDTCYGIIFANLNQDPGSF